MPPSGRHSDSTCEHPLQQPGERVMATPIGFEPTISTVTGWRVRPLHHGAVRPWRVSCPLDLGQRDGEGVPRSPGPLRSEEHTSELQSLMRTSYAVSCLKKKNTQIKNNDEQQQPEYA